MVYVQAICDYGSGDLAWAEVKMALRRHLPPGSSVQSAAVHSYATLELGFVLAQLGLAPEELRAPELILFGNCAPRKDRGEARKNNEGEGLVYGVLSTGVPILVVNSGYSLSFVREHLKEFWAVKVSKEGSQFRSRDIFPKVVGMLARGDTSFRGEKLNTKKHIPQVPHGAVAYVDSFGNIKTTYRRNDPLFKNVKPGAEFLVKVGNTPGIAILATGSFNVPEGGLALSPGSSGQDNRFMELFLRGNSAWRYFGEPPVETEIKLKIRNAS